MVCESNWELHAVTIGRFRNVDDGYGNLYAYG